MRGTASGGWRRRGIRRTPDDLHGEFVIADTDDIDLAEVVRDHNPLTVDAGPRRRTEIRDTISPLGREIDAQVVAADPRAAQPDRAVISLACQMRPGR
jgi:hypothetical protein